MRGAKGVALGLQASVGTPGDPNSLANQLPPDWRKALKGELEKPYFKALEGFLREERSRAHVEPPPEKVFAALHRTPVANVKVVLLGQDPYPTRGNATGLSFSVPPEAKVPPSLRNMFKVMNVDVGAPIPNHGNLEAWADRGVLLLNTVLTVREGEPNSHKGQGWEQFTRAILEVVNRKADTVAFLLLGKQAQLVAAQVDTTRHTIVAAPHPSPMSIGNPFGACRPYSAINAALEKAGREPIDWTIPNR